MTMKARFRPAVLAALFVTLLPACSALPETDAEVQAVRRFFSGQKILVTYREGGPVYGTYFFLQVDFCRSGTYKLVGQSRKQTVLGNEQVSNWKDQGKWEVGMFEGQVGVRSVSVSGQVTLVPVKALPNGEVSAGNGVTVKRQGAAQCK